jgi:hypothetical protein
LFGVVAQILAHFVAQIGVGGLVADYFIALSTMIVPWSVVRITFRPVSAMRLNISIAVECFKPRFGE